eukprot:282968_1
MSSSQSTSCLSSTDSSNNSSLNIELNQNENKVPMSDKSFEANNNICVSIEECNALGHLMSCLQYYELIKKTTKQESFDEYCDETYPNILNDY